MAERNGTGFHLHFLTSFPRRYLNFFIRATLNSWLSSLGDFDVSISRLVMWSSYEKIAGGRLDHGGSSWWILLDGKFDCFENEGGLNVSAVCRE